MHVAYFNAVTIKETNFRSFIVRILFVLPGVGYLEKDIAYSLTTKQFQHLRCVGIGISRVAYILKITYFCRLTELLPITVIDPRNIILRFCSTQERLTILVAFNKVSRKVRGTHFALRVYPSVRTRLNHNLGNSIRNSDPCR